MVQPCDANSTKSDNPTRLIGVSLRPGWIGGTLFADAVIDVLLDLEEYSTGAAAERLSEHPPCLQILQTVPHPSPGDAVTSRAPLDVKEPR